jgi:hypothetical protein
MMAHPKDRQIRIPCPACRRGRVFSTAELFTPTRSFVRLRKPCPHCGSTIPLQLRAPPHDAATHTSLQRAVLRFDSPLSPQHNDN